MNNVIIIPTERGPTPEERIQQASLEYSTDANLQKAFRDGAFWYKGGSEGFTEFACLLVFLYLIVQFGAFICGAADGRYMRETLRGKWPYIFPGAVAGSYVGDWLSK